MTQDLINQRLTRLELITRCLSCQTLFYIDNTAFPTIGRSGTLYVDSTNHVIYKWNGSSYDSLSGGGGGSPFATDILVNDLTIGKGGGNFSNNTVLGVDAMNLNTLGESSVVIGFEALMNDTFGVNTVIGYQASKNTGINTSYNTIIGFTAANVINSTYNVIIGHNSSPVLTTGYSNTIIGSVTAPLLTTGYSNIILGYNSGKVLNGNTNILIGNLAGNRLTTGNNNIIIANETNTLALISGSNNIQIGARGVGGGTGNNNVLIGGLNTASGLSVATADTVIIGNGAGTKRIYIDSTGSTTIGTTAPTSCALLDLPSTTKGLLLPRMTKVQRDAIVSPVAGLAVYQTDNTPGLRVYNGTNWMRYTETVD